MSQRREERSPRVEGCKTRFRSGSSRYGTDRMWKHSKSIKLSANIIRQGWYGI